MQRTSLAVIASVFLGVTVFAQAPQMPQPAPELKKLDYFAGDWKTEFTMKPSPFGPGGKGTGTDHIQWMQGNFFLLIHSKFAGPMGDGIEVAVLGYDAAKKTYTYASYDSNGEHDSANGTLEGDTWTWYSEPSAEMNGMKGRYTEKELSPTSYTLKYEVSQDGSTWTTAMEGKATKQ